MQTGIDSFAAKFGDPHSETGAPNDAEAMDQLLQRIEHADKVGLDVFGIGEHHPRPTPGQAPEFLDSLSAV